MCAESQPQAKRSRQWKWMMMLQAYFDDSGSEPSSPIYILGGVMLPKEWWDEVSEEWRAVLNHPPKIEYYKGSEVWSDKPTAPFAALRPNERICKVDALADVLVTYHPVAFSLKVEWATFKEFQRSCRLREPGNDPYIYLFFNALVLVHMYGIKNGNVSAVEFYFDNQNQIGKRVREWYPIFKSRCPLHMSNWLPDEAKFGDEKCLLPLQAADMMAWHQRRRFTGSLHRDSDKARCEHLSRFLTESEMGLQELISMATNLEIVEA